VQPPLQFKDPALNEESDIRSAVLVCFAALAPAEPIIASLRSGTASQSLWGL
jgi:hypothetical protein